MLHHDLTLLDIRTLPFNLTAPDADASYNVTAASKYQLIEQILIIPLIPDYPATFFILHLS